MKNKKENWEKEELERILKNNISIIEKAGEFKKGDAERMIYPIIIKLLSQSQAQIFKTIIEELGLKIGDLPAFPKKETDPIRLVLKTGVARNRQRFIKILEGLKMKKKKGRESIEVLTYWQIAQEINQIIEEAINQLKDEK